MIKIGLLITVILGVLKCTNLYECSWWIVVAPTIIAFVIGLILSKGIVSFFDLLSAFTDLSYERGRLKQMEKDQENNPKYKNDKDIEDIEYIEIKKIDKDGG